MEGLVSLLMSDARRGGGVSNLTTEDGSSRNLNAIIQCFFFPMGMCWMGF